ncbi:MAG: hypothetical protein AUK47_03975 [Deltaproteobacteria bacterium CG2_30_63_29]|nr:MAG: hypothetical protein AUK47_03975 [Deltaproteobacteria bacterium CG2_30_63_29]PJB46850.1 MAG: hypothetical protein CO108_04985 [Deltaproteobacteria bacterium CG_4_9_14_3_um_filter_63_12]
MATITNKTRQPLSVPLPGGKKLFLGPLNSGEISAKAVTHPPILKLVEAGEVELTGGEQKPRRSGGSTKGPGPTAGTRGPSASTRKTAGDR